MLKKSLYTLIGGLFLFLALPCAAFADDAGSSAQARDAHFGGLRLTADVMLGGGRCDDRTACLDTANDWDEKNNEIALLGQIHLAYLWGSAAYIGPEITVEGGSQMYIGGDLRARLVIPITDSSGVSMSVGFGFSYHVKYVDTDFHNGSNAINYLYIPFQLGYEYVFDNGFILGGTFQVNLNTQRKEVYEYSTDTEHYDKLAVLGFIGGGVTLGYKF